MTGDHRRLIEQVTDADFVEGLGDKPTDELRHMRDAAREAENELSFERRLCHARIDILKAELQRRSGELEGDLVSRLPEILSKDAHERPPGDNPLPDRAPDHSIPRSADVHRRRAEELPGEEILVRLPGASNEEIKEIIQKVTDLEKSLSERRHSVHEVLDAINAELDQRYKKGEATAL